MTKFTAVSVWFRGYRTVEFHHLPVENGKTILPASILNAMLDRLGVRRGDTYAIGA